MKYFIAIDGCKAGWIAIHLASNGKELSYELIESGALLSFIQKNKDSYPILIDMPIGLLEEGYSMRCCDRLARQMLGSKKASSVFPVPTQKALEKQDHKSASAENRELTGKGVPVQAWHLKDKLLEIDDLMKHESAFQNILLEFHPELAFACLNESKPVFTKKKRRAGRDERIALLERYLSSIDINGYYDVNKIPGKFAEDDYLDALAGAVMLMKAKGKLKELPGEEDCDGLQTVTRKGIKMRIIYI